MRTKEIAVLFRTGIFLDSYVEGIAYSTPTQSDITWKGQLEYQEGDIVQPSMECGGIILKTMNILLMFLLFILLTNCTFKIAAHPPSRLTYFEEEGLPYEPDIYRPPEIPDEERLPYQAAIYIPPQVAEQTVTKGGLCLLGVVHSWVLLVGESVSAYSEKYFKTLFKDVDVYSRRSDFITNKNIKLVVESYVKDLEISQSLRIKFILHTAMQDQMGRPVYKSEILGETKSNQAMNESCMGGVRVGESVLRDSFSEALEDAFDKLLQDVRTEKNWKRLKTLSNGKINKPELDSGESIFVPLEVRGKEIEEDTKQQKLAYVPKTDLAPEVSLRSDPKLVLEVYIGKSLKAHNFYDRDLNKHGSFVNNFVDSGGGTIPDRATGLIWEKGGSPTPRSLKRARSYVKKLNKDKFAGYSDWRLPTIEELASLLESQKTNGRHIDPLFDKKQARCWSSDEGPKFGGESFTPPQAWYVNFLEGKLGLQVVTPSGGEYSKYPSFIYVRAVRSLK